MAAPVIGSTVRYALFGTRQYYFVPTIVSKAAPTRLELDAGTDLTPEIADGGVEGFAVTGDDIETPDLATFFTSKIPGRTSSDDSSLTFYSDADSDDVRTLLPRGTNGFVVMFPEGDDEGVDTHTMDVFPVRVKAQTKLQDTGNAGQIQVQFTITAEPAENVAVPT